MILLKNENYILNIIKYGPIAFVIFVTFIVSAFFINEKYKSLEIEKERIEIKYIEENKNRVKSIVVRIHSLIEIEKNAALNELKQLVKTEVEQAYSIINSIYTKNLDTPNYSKEKTLDEIKTVLRNIRYLDNKGYFFIYELNGKNILNSEFPDIEDKNLWEHKDAKGTLILQEMTKILKNKDKTFYDWYWNKSKDDNTEYKKVGYFKKFEPFDIFIGSGAYINEFETIVQQRVAAKLNNLKFENFEHIFIYTLDGLCLVNPKKELVGTNRYNIKNKKGEYTLRNTLNLTKEKKAAFIKYTSTVKLNDKLKSNGKISYVQLYDDWKWMIGSGFYLESLNKEIENKEKELIKSNKDSIISIIIISLIIIFIFIPLSFYLSNNLRKRFFAYTEQLNEETKKTIEKEKLLVQQSKMATMGEMLGSIAHQWKQPISIISMSNGLLRINTEVKDFSTKEELNDAIDAIDNSVKNLSQTIDDFRNFFNPNKEKSLYKIADAFEETFKLTTSQYKSNNIEIIKNISDVELFGSQNELQQTLINILKNAKEELIKKDSSEKRLIFIDVSKDKKNAIIKIKDNANGIPLDIIENVFKSYFTTKGKEGGSGIGLYMSKQIIEGNMKGQISVSNVSFLYEDIKYTGAEFIISIPL